ncbi:MAG: 2-dehydro-3-deoxygalactonokinase [Alphaproteobacteria bacterium]|nr:2-dehydro-3-deoxygalactonokinase [Alphaproteobacteria bacterium]
MTDRTALIAVDWGTSSFRAYRLDGAGATIEQRGAPLGILKVEGGDFAGAFKAQIGDWLAVTAAPVLMAGMIGSRQGWSEAPYASCPAGPTDLAARLHPLMVDGRRCWIVPGLVYRAADGPPDVMRGEESQILGVIGRLGPGRHRLCLPGTHSKWVDVADGRIVSFATYMTGETFAVLRAHSILGRLMADGGDDLAWFDRGIRRAREGGSLLHHLFGVRTLGLFGDVPPEGQPHYLSGVLIGHELAAVSPGSGPVYLLGAPALAALYRRALELLGCEARLLDPDAIRSGLFALLPHLPRD